MSREIKFRGKRVDNGDWFYGTGITDYLNAEPKKEGVVWLWGNCFPENYYGWVQVRPETVGQYTGLNDSTKWEELTPEQQNSWLSDGNKIDDWCGIEIYEGDIVEAVSQYIVKKCKHYSKMEAGICNFIVYWDDTFSEWGFRHPIQSIHPELHLRELKVTGNIHDLLEQK